MTLGRQRLAGLVAIVWAATILGLYFWFNQAFFSSRFETYFGLLGLGR